MDIFSNFGVWGAGWTGWILPFLFGLRKAPEIDNAVCDGRVELADV